MVAIDRPKVVDKGEMATMMKVVSDNRCDMGKMVKRMGGDARQARYKPLKRELRSQGTRAHITRRGSRVDGIQQVLELAAMARTNASVADAAVVAFRRVLDIAGGCSHGRVYLRDCNVLLRELGDGGHMDACAQVLKTMRQHGIGPSIVTYSTLISRAGMWRRVELAEGYYETMILEGLRPDVQAYNSLINAYAKAGITDRALQVLMDMDRNQCFPTAVTLNSLMDSCARTGQLGRAENIFRLFEQRNITPTVTTYSNLIYAASRAGNMKQAFSTLRDMVAKGLTPSEVTYSVLLDGLGKAGRLEEAFRLLTVIKENGIQPNVITMSTLVDACGRNGRLDRAFQVYNEMLRAPRKADRPNSVTCSSLIDASLKAGDLDRFYAVLRDMRARGLPLTEVTYTSIITELSRLDKLDSVVEVMEMCKGLGDSAGVYRFYENLKAQGLAAEAPKTAYKAVMETILDGSEGTTKNTTASESSPAPPETLAPTPAVAVAAVGGSPGIDTKAKSTGEERLLQLYLVFREMQSAGVPADVGTYNTLINACAVEGDVDRALEAVELMQRDGVTPDAITYTSLLKACAFHQGECMVDVAEGIFGEMVQRTNHFSTYIAPTERTYQRLMQVYLHSNPSRTDKIWHLVEVMRKQGIEPSNFTWRVCARAAAKDKDVQRGIEVIERIRAGPGTGAWAKSQLGFDYKAWAVVVDLLENFPGGGMEKEAESLRQEMNNRYQPRA